jgi:predicted peroxiredoxin
MANYILINSENCLHSTSRYGCIDIAMKLAGEGNKVSVFLTQNAVLNTRAPAFKRQLAKFRSTGIKLIADEFALRERGIKREELDDNIKTSPIDYVVDRLAAGDKAVWY